MFSGFGAPKKSPDENREASNDKKPRENASKSSIHGFDPDALERAAKAAKELDASKNSQNAVRIIHEQEITRQKESETERAKFQAMQEQLALQRLHESEKIALRTLEEQTRHERARLEYKDQLDRQRMTDQINAQRHLNDEDRKKAEDSLRKQEQIRRKTLEYESELRQTTEAAKVKAEALGRIQQERDNHDLILENKKLEATEYRQTILEGIKLSGSLIGSGMREFISDKEKLISATATLSALAFGVYGARTATGVIGRYVESILGKPSLVRETSRKNMLSIFKSPISSFKAAIKPVSSEHALKNIVFESTLETRLKRVAKSTSNTRSNNGVFRNVLLAGPPGSGKTLFAKGLARESGLHYAIMTGGDVSPLGRDAVTEIHKLFDWANSTNKGVLLFIDEADAFLRKRSTEKISEDQRNSLNAFLYRTGEASKKIMLVYASNQPEQFDWAINDRIDEIVMFQLPHYRERLKMIIMYVNLLLVNPQHGSKPIDISGIDQILFETVARETEGFSGREISKLVIAWQAAVYGSGLNVLSEELMLQVLEENKQGKIKKLSWLNKEEINNLTSNA